MKNNQAVVEAALYLAHEMLWAEAVDLGLRKNGDKANIQAAIDVLEAFSP